MTILGLLQTVSNTSPEPQTISKATILTERSCCREWTIKTASGQKRVTAPSSGNRDIFLLLQLIQRWNFDSAFLLFFDKFSRSLKMPQQSASTTPGGYQVWNILNIDSDCQVWRIFVEYRFDRYIFAESILGWPNISFIGDIYPGTWHVCQGYQRSVVRPSTGLLGLNEPRDSGSHLSLLKSM